MFKLVRLNVCDLSSPTFMNASRRLVLFSCGAYYSLVLISYVDANGKVDVTNLSSLFFVMSSIIMLYERSYYSGMMFLELILSIRDLLSF